MYSGPSGIGLVLSGAPRTKTRTVLVVAVSLPGGSLAERLRARAGLIAQLAGSMKNACLL